MVNSSLDAKAMKSARQQLLRDPDIQPTGDVLDEALGMDAYDAYVRFVDGLAGHDISLEWRYYTDGKAWLAKGLHRWTGARGGQNEATAFWLSVWDGRFKVTIYIPEKARADALSLPLGDSVRQMIADAKPMGTRQAFFPLVFEAGSDKLFEAIYSLADFRKRMK